MRNSSVKKIMKRGNGAWISEENMGLTKMTENVENIQNLDTKPNAVNGLSAEELKAEFDKGAATIKKYLNETLVPELDAAFGESVPATREVNGKPLDEDITLTAEDVEAVPKTRRVNEQPLDSDITVGASDVPYTPSEAAPFYSGKNTVKAALDALTEGDVKLYFTDVDISAVAGTVTDLDGSMVYPYTDANGGLMPRNGEYVVGKNGYLAYADTSIDSDDVAVVSTGESLFNFATKEYVDNLVKLWYIDKTAEYSEQRESGFDSEDEFLRSLGTGRYYVCDDGMTVYTVETFDAGNVRHSTVRYYDDSGMEHCWVYENDTVQLAWTREDGSSGKYKVTKGNITIGKDAVINVPTVYGYYNDERTSRAANKGYVDNMVKFGYIDMTTYAALAGHTKSADDVAEYLMSRGDGRWMFNSDFDQHTEDLQFAVFVECVSYAEHKHWTVRIFEEDMTQYVRMYRQYSDNERETLLDMHADVDCPFGGIYVDNIEAERMYARQVEEYPTAVPNKKYVDDAIAGVPSADYIDKTEEFTAKVASDGQTAALKWIRSLPTGKYKFNANIYGDTYEEVHLLDNLTIPFEMDGDSYSTTHCVEQTYDVYGNHWFYIFYGDETVYYLEEHRVGGEYVMEGTFRDYVNSRIPQKYGSEGLVLTLKEDSTAEWKELLPAYSSADAGKALKVAADGTLYWG